MAPGARNQIGTRSNIGAPSNCFARKFAPVMAKNPHFWCGRNWKPFFAFRPFQKAFWGARETADISFLLFAPADFDLPSPRGGTWGNSPIATLLQSIGIICSICPTYIPTMKTIQVGSAKISLLQGGVTHTSTRARGSLGYFKECIHLKCGFQLVDLLSAGSI